MTLRELTPEELDLVAQENVKRRRGGFTEVTYVKFEPYVEGAKVYPDGSPVHGRFWAQDDLDELMTL